MSKAEELAHELTPYSDNIYAVEKAIRLLRQQEAVIKQMVEALEDRKTDVIARLQHHENIRADDDQYEDPEEWELNASLRQLNAAIATAKEVLK